MASTYELIIKAVDQSSGGLRKIERNVDRLEKKASGLSTTLKAAGGALAAFVTGGAARSIVTTTARFEDLEDTLKSVTGSALDGAEAFKFVKKFSTQTQFGVEELTQAYIKLAGAGIEPTEKLLTTFTDTAAVTTDQLGTLQAMTDLMSRTTAGGLGLEDLERLADRGVPVYKLLADNLGLARNEITEFGQSQAGAKLITDTLLQALNRTYGGATQGKMDNLSTAMSNFGIAVKNAADQIGQEMRPQLTAAITDATKFIEVNEKMISQMGVGFGGAIRASGQALQMLAENFNAIKNAAIGLIALRAAQTFVNIGAKVSSAIKPTQTLAGMFKTMMTVVGRSILRIPLLGSVLSQVAVVGTAAGKVLAAAFGGIGSSIGGLLGRIAVFRVAIAGLSALGPLLLNPFTLAFAAIGAALFGLFKYFEDQYFKLGDMTVSVGELLGAVWFGITKKIAGYWETMTQFLGDALGRARNFIVNAWQTIKTKAAEFIEPITNVFGDMFRAVQRKLKTWADNFIGTFVFVFKAVGATFKNLPNIFVAIFNGIITTAKDFGVSIITQFNNIGKALITAIKAPFTDDTLADALKLATTNAFAGLGDTITAELDKVSNTLPDYGAVAGEAFGTSYVDSAGEAIKGIALSVGTITGDAVEFAGEAFEAGAAKFTAAKDNIVNDLQGLVTEYRQHNFEVAQAAGSYDQYDDAILRTSRGLGVATQATVQQTAAVAEQGAAIDATAAKFAVLLEQLRLESIEAVETEAQNKKLYQALLQLGVGADVAAAAFDNLGLSINDLPIEQQMGKLNEMVATQVAVADANKALFAEFAAQGRSKAELEAARGVLGISAPKKEELTTEQQLVKTYGDQVTKLAELQAALGNVNALAKEAGVTQEFMTKKIQEQIESLDVYKDRAKSIAEIIGEGFKKASDSLADNLADAIVEGKSLLDVLKNSFKQALKNILSSILQSGIQKAMAGLFGGFGGGGMGGMFGSLFGGGGMSGGLGLLGGLFGGFFANGGATNPGKGYIVGEKGPEFFMPGTTGRVIPNDEMGDGATPPVINFNINAIDTQTGTEFILKNKKQIEGVVNEAYHRRGKVGIV